VQVTFPGTHDDIPDGESPQGEHLPIFCVVLCAVGVCQSASELHAATLRLRQLAGDSSSSGGGSSSRKSDQQDQARRAVNRIANAAAAAVGLDDQNNRHLITASYDDL
jgi:hypothetical protein